jgi:uncharacterized protein (TIGR02646 family)
MKQIFKKEPTFYINFIQNHKPNKWDGISEISFQLRQYMLSGLISENDFEAEPEQNHQCAYTEINITPDSNSSHIDHYYLRKLYPNLTFDWSNLFTSCNNEYYGAKYKDNKYKVTKEDYKYLICPSKENPKEYFSYSFTGLCLIKSNNENSIEYKKAKTTIEVFNLNEKSLVEQRSTVAKQINAYHEYLTLKQIKEYLGKFDSFIESIYEDLNKIKTRPQQN